MECNRVSIQVSAGALILLAALLLLLPLQWVCAALFAGFVHELYHGMILLLLGGSIREIRIGCRGVVMETQALSFAQEGICAIAGPIGSFSLLLIARWFPRVAICGVIHGLYNLIPLLPLDGGRVLRAMIYRYLSPPTAHKVLLVIQRCILLLAVLLSLAVAAKAGIWVVFLGIFVLSRKLQENPLAKKPFWRYNRWQYG